MQQINIDSIVYAIKNKLEYKVKNIDKYIKLNICEIVFGKQYFIDLGPNITDVDTDKIKKLFQSKGKFIKELKKIFLQQIVENGILLCPYCGKQSHIQRNIDGKLIRLYDIEHFLPKSAYPNLAINLYNWLPVCKSCNHLKGSGDTLVNTNKDKEIFYPYFGRIYKNGNEIKIKDETFDNKVSFTKKEKLIFKTEHSTFFKLAQIYLNSQDTFNDFDFMHDKYTKIKDEKMKFESSSKNNKDMINYFFKNYYPENEKDILKYSNGKFKKDVIEDITVNL